MSILKFKIAQAEKRRQNHPLADINACAQVDNTQDPAEPIQRRLRTRVLRPNLPSTLTPRGSTSCKNIMKNYSRIFTVFALSPLALPYLTPLLQQYNLQTESFMEFVESRRQAATCIKGLRDMLLLVMDTDSFEVAVMKTVFQEMCVVFLKIFCVNWIFHGKIVDKTAHLKYRLKILRRIQNPITFTSIETI